MNLDAKLGMDVFKLDKEPNIVVNHDICAKVCVNRPCLYVCPAHLYTLDDQNRIIVNWEGCLECGTCLICCDPRALQWAYPRGGFGVQYRMG